MRFTTRWRALHRAVTGSAVLAAIAAIVPGTAAAAGNTYYVAPNGSDNAAGTQVAPWASIARAQAVATAGDTVYFRAGTYAYTRANSACASRTARVDAITLSKSGTSGNPIRYWAYPGEKPVFDFSAVRDDCRIKGFNVTGSHLHLKGLEVTGVPQNNSLNAESWGIWVSGSNNTFELVDTHHHMGTGLFINGGGGNLVLNTDSHDNYDLRSSDGPGENADGFGAHYTPAGRPANVFRGSRAWWNADDGYDLISTYSPVIIENSWSWRNGYVPGTTTPSGNGAGFKVGGFGAEYDAGAVKHTVRFSVALLNKAAGFYSNHHPVANDYINNTGYGNHPNFDMRGITSSGASVGRGNLRNNIAYNGTATANMTGTSASHNSWNLGLPLSDAQFQSVATSGWDAPRQSDGSLPALPHLRLAANSTLIDKGTNVGLPYQGAAPDLGAFERLGSAPPPSRYEAEAAPAVCQGTIDANQSGFSGTGFCNGSAAIGAYAQFTVDAATAGTATLGIRFANGSSGGTARPANLVVNGSTVATVSFESTGSWTAWTTKTVTASLTAGGNTVRLDPTTADGLPNIDHLTL
ncbi:parallel beta helix pectate lyase-like protein [Saccharothrix carnea]|uniref:Parallel beta helix pectate lyase-like protein n=1 Tax=Saccharothrix carnea TaxID=1280637 RepID=A0A2P8IF25_SACCR|nr:carbohydrate-binding protein [Saccharothrix carnea]PSL57079.1 parallel beta helix pectate lyase-like protein [Saccharothrix carnea]